MRMPRPAVLQRSASSFAVAPPWPMAAMAVKTSSSIAALSAAVRWKAFSVSKMGIGEGCGACGVVAMSLLLDLSSSFVRSHDRSDRLRVLDRYLRIAGRPGNVHAVLGKQRNMFLHSPPRLVKAIFNRVADTGKAFEVRRIEPEEVGVFCGFDHQGVIKVDHFSLAGLLPSGLRCKFLLELPSPRDSRRGL